MKIGVHSDLHTEFSLCTIDALDMLDILVLAGDIGDLQTVGIFFDYLRRQAPDLPVLYVLGNHEFYGMEFFHAKSAYAELAQQFNIHLLDDSTYEQDGVLFIGSILWSDFCLAGTQAQSMQWAQQTLPDFQYIRYGEGLFTADLMLQAHQQAYRAIDRALAQQADKKVVISHFLPSRALVAPKHQQAIGGLLKSAYWTSDLPQLYAQADLWIYGHSHDNIHLNIDTTRFISNQRGYHKVYNVAQQPDYERNFRITL